MRIRLFYKIWGYLENFEIYYLTWVFLSGTNGFRSRLLIFSYVISPPLFLESKPALTGPCHDTAGRGLTIVPIVGSVDSEIKTQKTSKTVWGYGVCN